MNKVVLMGRLTHDPERKTFPSGSYCCRFSLAVNRRFAKEEQQQADFINCVAWGKTADFIERWFTKGRMLAVVGEIQTQSWEYQGKKQYKTEVVVSEAYFTGEKHEDAYQPMPSYNEPQESFSDGFVDIGGGEDDLPF
ncbi:MAG: single-stranded DNA-binding protein [Candidatus Ornithomonoglobus sp.]